MEKNPEKRVIKTEKKKNEIKKSRDRWSIGFSF
jgi:hypothetical protein